MAAISRFLGTTSEILGVFIPDATVTTGAGLANISSSSVTIAWWRNDMSAVSSYTATTGTLGTWGTSSFVQLGSTSTLGWYMVSVPDGCFVSGRSCVMQISGTLAAMPDVPVLFELTKTNNQDYLSTQTVSTLVGGVRVSTSVGVSSFTLPVGVSSFALPVGVSTGVGVSSFAIDVGVSSLTATALSTVAFRTWDEVLTAATHNVPNSAGRRLRNVQDFGIYDLASVWVDEVGGSSTGTTDGEDATVTNRANDFDNAQTVATSVGLDRIHVQTNNSITLTATVNNFEIWGENYTLALGSQDISGCFINGATVSGVGTGTTPVLDRCLVGNTTLPPSRLFNCGLTGTLTVGSAGAFRLIDCRSGVAGAGTPTIDMGAGVGATTLELRRWSGGLTLDNVQAGDVVSVDVVSGGTITVNGTGGTVVVRGLCNVVDGSSGSVTITETSVVNMTKIRLPMAVSSISIPVGVSSISTPVGVTTGVVSVSSLTIPVGVSSISIPVGVSTATAGVNEGIADAFLGRNVSGGANTGRLIKEAFYAIRNKVDTDAGIVYLTDDTTSSWSFSVSTVAGNPIVAVDPD